jgi:3D (Asp-Asp-Asp) domain-containing protein
LVEIRRAKPVVVSVDGHLLRTRTQSESVGEVLAEVGVALLGQDFCDPPLDAPVADGSHLRVVRVTERTEIEQEELPFETEWVPDDRLELDTRYLDDPGAVGVRRRRYKVVYHDQSPVERVLEEDWLAQAPRARRIAYGTKIVVRTLDTPDGEIEYWRRIRVFRTAYTAATCGKTPDHPLYGITRLGWQMQNGIIATDPRVIRLRTPLYVPGYGLGVAGDTGGLIVGRHIDLGYEEDSLVWHFEWGDVYLLTPVPPASEIPYILPDYPRGVY